MRVFFVSLLLALASCASAQSVYQGHVVFRAFFNSSVANTETPFEGTATLVQNVTATVATTYVTLNVRGLQSNKTYGVHVHTWGDLSGSFNHTSVPLTMFQTVGTVPTVGGHFDVQGRGANAHNCAPHADRHTGDLGNITVAANIAINDTVTYTLSSELLDLGIRSNSLIDSIIGRAIVIHELPDGCVQVNVSLGSWVAVGVIGIHNTYGNAAKQDTLPATIKANVLVLNASNKVPVGDIQLSTDSNGVIRAYGIVGGFAPNSVHGMHVHVWGNEDSAATSGPHYSQYLADFGHSLPPSTTRHWGDLGNVTADENGVVFFNNVDVNANLLSLWNPTAHGIIGRTLTFHAFGDDGTTIGATAYGGRLAYGVIGLANNNTVFPALPVPQAPTTTTPPTTAAPTTNGTTTTPPVTTSPPTTNGTTTTPPTVTTSPPTTNPNATTIPPTLPPSTATHNQANVFIMLIAVMMAAFVLA